MKKILTILFLFFVVVGNSQLTSLVVRNDTLFSFNPSTGVYTQLTKTVPAQSGQSGKFISTNGSVYSWGLPTASDVGLGNINNTSDLSKPISTATQAALDLKQNSLGFTPYNSTNPNNYISSITSQNVTTALGYTPYNATNPNGYISSITGLNGSSLTGLTKTQVGLANVDNTTDVGKPISTLTQTALNTKQATLVSATNIKTINGSTVLGSGDLVVSAAAATSTSGVAATPTASGTVTITHNLGRTPAIIRIYSISSFTSNAAATPVPFSTGTWNSTGNRCLYMVINGTTTQVSQTSTVFSIIMVTSAGNNITGVIGNVTPTSFDIVFTETGTHTAGNFLWESQ